MDRIRIDRLELDCIVGLRPDERTRQQRIRLDLCFGIDAKRAGRSGRITQTCDYGEVADEVVALLHFRRYRLIEMATEELAAMLLGLHPLLDDVNLRIEKPGALEGRARAASVEITRRRGDFSFMAQTQDYGAHELLLETREAELSLYTLNPGKTCEFPPYHQRTLYLLINGELRGETSSLRPLYPHTDPLSERVLRCTSEEPARVLCCKTAAEMD